MTLTKVPPHLMKVQYCGGKSAGWAWAYRKKVEAAIESLERNFPGQFSYEITKDPETTRNFEWTLFKNRIGPGVIVHSK